MTTLGNSHVYPWSFRHASWLINRYRVLEKERKTSYEVWSGRKYQGKICLFGESVMYRHLTACKGEPRFGRGIWVGKFPWSDCHIVLTPGGAESRTVRVHWHRPGDCKGPALELFGFRGAHEERRRIAAAADEA